MLLNFKTVANYELQATNGEIGSLKDLFFDDVDWTIRYIAVNSGSWLHGRQVLLSPHALLAIDRSHGLVTVSLTKEQIENSPALDSHKPVSRQFEQNYYDYFGFPPYWSGTYIWGAYPLIGGSPYPYLVGSEEESNRSLSDVRSEETHPDDVHLRSTGAVTGYDVQASDGAIGHISDFIFDDDTWMIRYLVIDTRNWWPGKKVLVSPKWIVDISWGESVVTTKLSRDAIQRAPEYTDDTPLTRAYESELHDHYGTPGYWSKNQHVQAKASVV